MSEEAWLREADPHELIQLIARHFVISRRKLRHFVCTCVRHQLPAQIERAEAEVLAFAERIADDEVNVGSDDWAVLHPELEERTGIGRGLSSSRAGLLQFTVGDDIYDEAHWVLASLKDSGADAVLPRGGLREIFGNPFRPVDFAPWRTGTAVSLARQLYESRDFSALPILADALQDAGCDDTDVLGHCRGNGPHVRGCWVVDGVLGKG
ncbi:hypothetical protein [Frigoriglobus tundricola]|uniref:SMI1/KNR4 family protein n=1 Tax=Frigoriglobus tundricola TaxID=2774151 RepID=A0A6M5YL53_9BACT|nr:hypothetical protein [Frigoriglobus tundricola]QJW94016.1 hypothetical protein FTUN_1535 [Frigoriglobus tundricola]